MWLWRLMAKFRNNKYLVANSSIKESGATWWQNFQKMQVAPHGGQISNLLKWSHQVANFPTIASGVTWWLNFQLIQVVPPGGQMVVKMEWALNVWNFDLFSMCMLIKCKNIVSRNIAHQICEKYTFLEKKYPKKSEKVDLVDLSPDLDFIMMRKYTVETSLHTSIPPVQVNHNQYHCLHHQSEAYSACTRRVCMTGLVLVINMMMMATLHGLPYSGSPTNYVVWAGEPD